MSAGSSASPIRLGAIDYANAYPIDWALEMGYIEADVEVTRAVPAELNRMLTRGDLDVSAVSALHFAENARHLIQLPVVSISSDDAVQSVLLFSRYPAEELSGKRVCLTDEGKTTPALLKILCAKLWKTEPVFETAHPGPNWKTRPDAAAGYLVIGDSALRAAFEKPEGWRCYDLAQEWQRWTGLPFVFAVWAARREYHESHPQRLEDLSRMIRKSLFWAYEHPSFILKAAEEKTGLSREHLTEYYRKLRFNWSHRLRESLQAYLAYCCELGLLAAFDPASLAAVEESRGLMMR